MKLKQYGLLFVLMGLLVLIHQVALSWLGRHDLMSCLMSPGAHVPVGALVFSLCFLALRMAVILLFPGIAVYILTWMVIDLIRRKPPGEKPL